MNTEILKRIIRVEGLVTSATSSTNSDLTYTEQTWREYLEYSTRHRPGIPVTLPDILCPSPTSQANRCHLICSYSDSKCQSHFKQKWSGRDERKGEQDCFVDRLRENRFSWGKQRPTPRGCVERMGIENVSFYTFPRWPFGRFGIHRTGVANWEDRVPKTKWNTTVPFGRSSN